MTKNLKLKTNVGGRPAGRKTRYRGIGAFCRSYGCSGQFARMVLDGKATSRPMMEAWGEWQATRA